MKTLILLVTPFLIAGCSLFGIRSEETPNYEVVKKSGSKEIRHYTGYLVAKTVVQGDYETAQGQAFRRLADYIFGKNQSKTEMKMTAPVTQSSAETIKMTAPVTQKPAEGGGWIMSFVMPSKYTLQTLPKPIDERVIVEEVPSHYVATIRFTGLTSEDNNQKKANALKDWIESLADYKPVSTTWQYAGYDPPWTIPFLRRQEVHIEVQKQE